MLGPLAQQVPLDLLAPRVSKDRLDHLETVEVQDHLAPQDSQALQEHRGLKEQPEQPERQVLVDSQDFQDPRDSPVQSVLQVAQVIEEILDPQDQLDNQERLVITKS